MRLIDADALLKALNDYGLSYRADINGMIMQAPTITPSGDLISRADAIDAVMAESRKVYTSEYANAERIIYEADAIEALAMLPSAEQVISKLNNPCDSLLTDESNGSKEHKSKLDLISRQDVIEALCSSSVYAWSIEQDQTAHDWALNIIKALPSAEAEQGVWEHIESMWEDNIFKCSKCGNPLKIPTVDGEPIYNYCIHCGAKMGNAWGERND